MGLIQLLRGGAFDIDRKLTAEQAALFSILEKPSTDDNKAAEIISFMLVEKEGVPNAVFRKLVDNFPHKLDIKLNGRDGWDRLKKHGSIDMQEEVTTKMNLRK